MRPALTINNPTLQDTSLRVTTTVIVDDLLASTSVLFIKHILTTTAFADQSAVKSKN